MSTNATVLRILSKFQVEFPFARCVQPQLQKAYVRPKYFDLMGL